MAELVYSVKEAAEALGISPKIMYDLVHQEGFPAFRRGGKWMISKTRLAAWVEQEADKGASAPQHNPTEHENCRSWF